MSLLLRVHVVISQRFSHGKITRKCDRIAEAHYFCILHLDSLHTRFSMYSYKKVVIIIIITLFDTIRQLESWRVQQYTHTDAYFTTPLGSIIPSLNLSTVVQTWVLLHYNRISERAVRPASVLHLHPRRLECLTTEDVRRNWGSPLSSVGCCMVSRKFSFWGFFCSGKIIIL